MAKQFEWNSKQTIDWLLQGDAAIRWQTMRDLLDAPQSKWQAERKKVAATGWGARFLSFQDADGRWGGGIYSPKWISTTYTLLQLRELGLDNEFPAAQRGTRLVLDAQLGAQQADGSFAYLARTDLCVVGMDLALAVYFRAGDARVEAMVTHLLECQMHDGGWNCSAPKTRGVTHSSFHTTFNVLDGLRGYLEAGHRKYRAQILEAEARALEFMYRHRLFRSHKTGEIIHPKFMVLAHPYRWHYDVLRGLDYMQRARAPRDSRAAEGIELVRAKQRSDGLWSAPDPYKGRNFFRMEPGNAPSRWNTLRALRVLRWWEGS